jgi:hypothetical protein
MAARSSQDLADDTSFKASDPTNWDRVQHERKAIDPLPSTRSDIEISDRGLKMYWNTVEVKSRIQIRQIGGGRIAELLVHSNFLELIIQGIGLLQVMRIT